MPQYTNPAVPHEVNVAKTSTLAETLRLLLALAVCSIVAVIFVIVSFRVFAPFIPFRYEQKLAAPFAASLDRQEQTPAQRYLQSLADSLAAHMAMPADMQLTVHTSTTCTPNAFATLGGHIVVTQGLLDSVDSENALAMVLAHEIAHIKHRDPIVSTGSGVVLAILAGAVFGNSDYSSLGSSSAMVTQLHFSRSQEKSADGAALDALQAKYGHTSGAASFFLKILEIQDRVGTSPEFLSTHPDTRNRLKRIEAYGVSNQNAQLTPLPDFLRQTKTGTDD